MIDSKSFKEKVASVNETLKKGEPKNFTSDHKGFAGYKPQNIIDAVNTEFIGDWGITVVDKKNYMDTRSDGKKVLTAFVHVRLKLNGQEVDAMASHPDNQGDLGDAYKAAESDAMKKAFAHFSIGRRAYLGLLNNKK